MRSDGSAQLCRQLRQSNAVLNIAIIFFEELVGNLLNHLANITGLAETQGIENLVGSFDLHPEGLDLVLFRLATLLRQVARPVLIQYKQVVGQKLPILL